MGLMVRIRRNKPKSSGKTTREMEINRGVGGCRCEKELEEVNRRGQKWSEMKILDFNFRREYLESQHIKMFGRK